MVTFNAGKALGKGSKSVADVKHPMSTKVLLKKTFEMSSEMNADSEKHLGATYPTQDKARQADFSELTDQ